MNRKLLRGEYPVATWMDVTLTTHRIWQVVRDGSTSAMVSFPVEAVQWTKLGRSHLPYLLWMALLVALLGIVALEHDRTVTYWLFGVVFLLLLLYATSRRLILSIGAGHGEILVHVAGEGASVEAALEFIHQVETRRLVTPGAPERQGTTASPSGSSNPAGPVSASGQSSHAWVSPPEPAEPMTALDPVTMGI